MEGTMKRILCGLGAAALSIVCASAIVLGSAVPGEARNWSKNPANLANDYLGVYDDRGGGDHVIMIWAASPLLPRDQQTPAAMELLDKYVIIGAAHGHFSKLATASFDPPSKIDVFDQNGQPLVALTESTMPPIMLGLLTILQSALSRAMGPMGQGIHWSVFEAGDVRACTKGGISVQFAGTKYTYDTPVPGCP
ncbi:MAG: hypothetical protein E7774_16165 [Bradyrhizobium sp.]|nr:MAG: hypothetical protein E7774_16165 [Bradyrhizobium sp.]